MRFLLDANLSPSMIASFASRGHDAIHINELAPSATPDHDVAALANQTGRCLITGDFDFANVRDFVPREFTGIVVLWHPRGTGAPYLSSLLTEFLDHLPELGPLTGKLVIVELGRIRVRD